MGNIGIYKITNIKNGKIYIGSSSNLNRRYYYHINYLKNNKHSNIHLQRAFNIDGEKSFKFEIIEFCEIDVLVEREEYYINFLNCLNDNIGYNINPNGDRPPSWLGRKHKEETKIKIGLKQKGKKISDYAKEIASITHKGKKLSEKQKQEISDRTKGDGNPMYGKTPYDIWLEKFGKEIADEKYKDWKQKISKSSKGDGNPMYGKTPYDIWLEKFGKEIADEKYKDWKQKISNTYRNNKILKGNNLETNKKIIVSDETKKKQSLKRKGELNPSCKIKDIEIPKIIDMINNGKTIKEISIIYNVCTHTIRNIKNGKRKI